MKLNKWTAALAALGAVSVGSVAHAAESAMVANASSTVLSGYVDTSTQWNLGTGNSHAPAYKYGGPAKADGFNLNAVKISLEKPLDETEWAAGYKADLMLGPDANTLATQSPGAAKADFAVRQAYVSLRAPIGNGLNFKVGVFDSIIGYESTDALNNPNFTRSWGHTFEPSTHTGVMATYEVNKMFTASAGLANTVTPSINNRANNVALLGGSGGGNETYKAYMLSVALTAPDDWDFLAGSSLYAGLVNGCFTTRAQPQDNYYVGATIRTPVTGLRLGASFDYNNTVPVAPPGGAVIQGLASHSYALYASYQATEKLSLHARAEYNEISANGVDLAQGFAGIGLASSTMSYTGTLQYDLWKNVLSRLEIRWDHALDGTKAFGGTSTSGLTTASGHTFGGTLHNSYIVAANIVYKF